MQLCTAQALSRKTGAEITIHAPFPDLDRSFYQGYQVIPSSRRRLIRCTWLWIRSCLWSWLKDHVAWDINFLVDNRELQAFLQADAIVDLSGDMLTDDYGPHVAYSHYLPIMIALALKRPVCLCAQTIGPFRYTGRLALALLNRAAYVSIRDRLSLNYLKSLGVKSDRLVLTADMAFLLEPAEAEAVDEIFSREGLPASDTPVLGVAVSFLIAHHFKRKGLRFREGTFFQAMAKELDALVDALGCGVVFIGQVIGPTTRHDDRQAARLVHRLMSRGDQAWVMTGDYSPAELKGVISRFTLFLGARMHANLAALSSGVPCLALSYSLKTPGIMSRFGLQDYVLDISELGQGRLTGLAQTLMRSRSEICPGLKQTSAELRLTALKNVEGIMHAAGDRG